MIESEERSYVEQHGLDELFDQMRNKLLEDRPDQPLPFLANYLEHMVVLQQDLKVRRQHSSSESTFLSPQDVLISSEASPVVQMRRGSTSVEFLRHLLEESSQEMFSSLSFSFAFGMDIGGTLCKITFFEPLEAEMSKRYEKEIDFIKKSVNYGETGIRDAALSFEWNHGRFHFLNFETRNIDNAVRLFKENELLASEKILMATGGGAQKYASLFRKELDVELIKGDELGCLLFGLNFMLDRVPEECFFLEDHLNPTKSSKIPFNVQSIGVYPYILVNIGSGVSILMVKSDREFKRISGTSIGGGTFLGLCKLLTQCETFEEAMELASQGNPHNIDMLVKDIYGGSYKAFNLSADTVASSFGRVLMKDAPSVDKYSRADIAASLLRMIGINIAQLAYLCAVRYNVAHILFAGNFLRQNRVSMGALSFSIDYWSHGFMRALFLKHEGYFGSIGAFLLQEKLLIDNLTESSDEKWP
jgi:type II pantothenate kinase